MLYILLAAYNEEESLPALLRDTSQLAAEGQWNYRVVVVNDGSTDATGRCLCEMENALPLTVVTHARNQGLAAALRTGFTAVCQEASPEDVVITLDADNTHPPYLIQPMETLITHGFGVVIASRFVTGGEEVGVSGFRRMVSRGARLFFRSFFRYDRVQDYTCGYRAYRVSLLQSALEFYGTDFICSQSFSVTAELLLNLFRWKPKIAEVPLVLRYDSKIGASKIRLWKTVRDSFRLLALPKWHR